MSELLELVKLQTELDERSTKVYKEVWQPKFEAINSKEEFQKVQNELMEEAGYPASLPGMLHVELCFARDAFRVRTGYFKDKEK